jgi:hypothetical protein
MKKLVHLITDAQKISYECHRKVISADASFSQI